MKEIWEDIKDYEGYYQVSNLGKVRSRSRLTSYGRNLQGKTLSPRLSKQGYLYVILSCKNKRRNIKVHRLVASTFIVNTENKPCINHKNMVKTCNEVPNLEWCTHKENSKHAYATGLLCRKGSKNNNSRLTEADILQIRQSNLSQKKLAIIFGVSSAHISRIINNKRW